MLQYFLFLCMHFFLWNISYFNRASAKEIIKRVKGKIDEEWISYDDVLVGSALEVRKDFIC